MVKIEGSVFVDAPVEKVFRYVNDATNLPEIWPSLVEVKDYKPTDEGMGSSYRWVYKMAGMRFEGSTEWVEYAENVRLVLKDTGGIDAKREINFKEENGGTRYSTAVEYTVPIPLLGKLAESFIRKQNEHEMNVFLANLKSRMEA